MKSMLFLSILSFAFFCTNRSEIGSLGYTILDKEIHIKKDSSYFEIEVELENYSNRNILLYAFKRVSDSSLSDSLLRIQRPGAGNAIFITDYEGNRMPNVFTFDMHGDDYLTNPMVEDSLNNIFEVIRSEYMNGKVVLKAGEKKIVNLRINLKSHPSISQLTSGEYLVYFVYYVGDELTKPIEEIPVNISLVDEILVKDDQNRYNAMVFKGWVRTNQVKLIVE